MSEPMAVGPQRLVYSENVSAYARQFTVYQRVPGGFEAHSNMGDRLTVTVGGVPILNGMALVGLKPAEFLAGVFAQLAADWSLEEQFGSCLLH